MLPPNYAARRTLNRSGTSRRDRAACSSYPPHAQMLRADGALACEAIFSFGLFEMERRKLINPTPAWRYAIGADET